VSASIIVEARDGLGGVKEKNGYNAGGDKNGSERLRHSHPRESMKGSGGNSIFLARIGR